MLAISGTTLYGYNLTNSLRFRGSASAYLTRTPSVASGQNQWTFSTWVKRCSIGNTQYLIGGNINTSGSYRRELKVELGDTLSVYAFDNSSGYYFNRISARYFRDPSSWYHIVVQFDPDNATSANKIIAYVNNEQITWGTSADSGVAGSITSTAYRSINNTYRNDINAGYQTGGAPIYFSDNYLAETIMVSGSLVSPSSFGATNSIGIWQPIKYTGSYGTNGFYLPFTDNSALTTSSNVGLGKDFSGNGNYWTTNNISITSGTTYDSMTDVPTLTSATSSNFAVLNPLYVYNANGTLSDGNLSFTGGNNTWIKQATMPISTKNYCEVTCITKGANDSQEVGLTTIGSFDGIIEWLWSISGNRLYVNGVLSGISMPQVVAGDIIGMAVDPVAKTCSFYRNNTLAATVTYTGTTNLTFYVGNTFTNGSWSGAINFGQRPFTYTPPTGYVALNTYNLSTPTIKAGNKYVNTIPFTAVNGAGSVTVGFQPDFTWIKDRQSTIDHYLHDSVRGYGNYLSSNTTGAAGTGGGVTSATSTGFNYSIGNSNNWVAWNWQAGQGTTSTNTNGTITSTVSVNANAGFSIVTYTGSSPSGTVGHGLGVAPKMIIVKQRNVSGNNWPVWFSGVTSGTQYLYLNGSNAIQTSVNYWNSTVPTSSVFSVGDDSATNTTGSTYVAYCWTPIPGYSEFGTWQNNNSTDGTFVYCGFSPAVIILKNYDNAEHWYFRDIARQTYNVVAPSNNWLQPSTSNTEAANGATTAEIDVLSNGFKIRTTNPAAGEISYGTRNYIYAAWASNPFKYANAK